MPSEPFVSTPSDPRTEELSLPEDLKRCVDFHGHLCPGLIYGYRVAKAARTMLELPRAPDEETVAVCENDSCAVDALQVILGTTAGKGNLILADYGKNAYTVIDRLQQRAVRFSRTTYYQYGGTDPGLFHRLEKKLADGTATYAERLMQKRLKALDLLQTPFDSLFTATKTAPEIPPYAPLARSVACAGCGEMTMETKMTVGQAGNRYCFPCTESGKPPV